MDHPNKCFWIFYLTRMIVADKLFVTERVASIELWIVDHVLLSRRFLEISSLLLDDNRNLGEAASRTYTMDIVWADDVDTNAVLVRIRQTMLFDGNGSGEGENFTANAFSTILRENLPRQ